MRFFVKRENDLFQNNCPKRIVLSHDSVDGSLYKQVISMMREGLA